jgi:hypothetical protein
MTLGMLLTLCATLPTAQVEGVKAAPVALQELRIRKLDPKQKVGTESIWVRTELVGDLIKQSVKSGNLKVVEARDDQGIDLIGTMGSAQTLQPAMKALLAAERASGRIDFEIKMKAPGRGAKSLSVKGSIDLLVVGERVNVDVVVKSGSEVELKHAELEAAGLKLKTAKTDAVKNGEKMVGLIVEGNEFNLLDVELVDGAGKAVRAGAPLVLPAKSQVKARFYTFPDKVPSEYTLRAVVAKGSRTVTVPFDFAKLELP